MSRFPRCASTLAAACLGLLVGCHSFSLPGVPADKSEKPEKPAALGLPSKTSFRVSQYVFYADFDIKRDQPIFRELADMREQLLKELHLPEPDHDTLISVYLFGTEAGYRDCIHTNWPALPNRRAFYIGEPRGFGGYDRLVFTFWSPRIRQDLRHELTHALLHSVLKDVPLWLDEGLAEYYELPPTWNGVNQMHARELRRRGAQPDLKRLEELSDVGKMNGPEYQEAWAWVYLMLRTSPEAKEVLLAYLQQLRTKPNPGPLQPRLAAALPTYKDAFDRLLTRIGDEPAGEKR